MTGDKNRAADQILIVCMEHEGDSQRWIFDWLMRRGGQQQRASRSGPALFLSACRFLSLDGTRPPIGDVSDQCSHYPCYTHTQTQGTNEGEMCYDQVRAAANVNVSGEICWRTSHHQPGCRASTLSGLRYNNKRLRFVPGFLSIFPHLTISSPSVDSKHLTEKHFLFAPVHRH